MSVLALALDIVKGCVSGGQGCFLERAFFGGEV